MGFDGSSQAPEALGSFTGLLPTTEVGLCHPPQRRLSPGRGPTAASTGHQQRWRDDRVGSLRAFGDLDCSFPVTAELIPGSCGLDEQIRICFEEYAWQGAQTLSRISASAISKS